ncbi:hypothetical protein RISK_003651 [Rhodopirellula islandica]|uniref:Uncharacterized protein n=1 Tax=Rhodopirellula islandica TaxID=595434 RepID=A0A0J1BBP2_RHOIS|nr:hypothetical protein RISK_003651 [Rhodopirellula islandica]
MPDAGPANTSPAQILKLTIVNFTFSIDPPSHPSPPVAAPRLVEQGA